MIDFSVLQAVYKKDDADFLDKCFNSIYLSTVKPKVIILVKDGQITEELDDCIKKWTFKLPIKTVGYDSNQGLAHALNYGLQFVTTPLIARMDSDDICYESRFESQLKEFDEFPDLEICGTGISEFYIDESGKEIIHKRMYRERVDKYSKSLYKGTPLAHPTLMIKTDILKCYRYSEETHMNEDIDLWFRLIKEDHVIYNIQETLLKFRITDSTFKRRGFYKSYNELKIYTKYLFEIFGFSIMYLYTLFRFISRLLPSKIVKRIYLSNLRNKVLNKD